MERGFVVRGKLRGRRVDLDEPVAGLDGDVELFVRALRQEATAVPDILEVIAGIPPGKLSKLERLHLEAIRELVVSRTMAAQQEPQQLAVRGPLVVQPY